MIAAPLRLIIFGSMLYIICAVVFIQALQRQNEQREAHARMEYAATTTQPVYPIHVLQHTRTPVPEPLTPKVATLSCGTDRGQGTQCEE